MKTLLLALVVVLGFAGAANADIFTLDGTNVGSLDTFKAKTSLGNSGDATELAWVQSLLGNDFALDAKYDTQATDWKKTTESGTYALNLLPDAPEYFLIKTASSSGYDHFLFQNNANLDWAVINLAKSVPGVTIKNVGKISHIDEFNDPKSVPEPATMLLLGSGLIGMAAFRRKFKK